MSYGRPWYVQATDAVHRLTVLGILGATGYFAFGLFRTLYANRNRRPIKPADQFKSASENRPEGAQDEE